jgi:hypothetical protein
MRYFWIIVISILVVGCGETFTEKILFVIRDSLFDNPCVSVMANGEYHNYGNFLKGYYYPPDYLAYIKELLKCE